jgi:hypothetical protein
VVQAGWLEDAGIHPSAHLFASFLVAPVGGATMHRRQCTLAPVRRPLCPLLPSLPTTEQEPNQPWCPLYRFVAAGGGRDHDHLRSTQ